MNIIKNTVILLNKYLLFLDKILIKYKKIISYFIYILCILSFFFLTDPYLNEETGELSISILWFLLWLPIISKVIGIKLASTLMLFRRELGIFMGVLLFIHSTQYFIQDFVNMPWDLGFWIYEGKPSFTAWGFLGVIISVILTLTSNNYSMKKLGGKLWKNIHRLVYLLLLFGLLHVLYLESNNNPGIINILEIFSPFIAYVVGKVLQWKGIRLLK